MKYNSSSHYNNSIEVQWYKFYSSKSTLWCKNTIAKTISPLVTSSKKPIVGCYRRIRITNNRNRQGVSNTSRTFEMVVSWPIKISTAAINLFKAFILLLSVNSLI